MVNFIACELKLNCRNLRRVTVVTSSNNEVSNYILLWSVHSFFHWCKNYKNRPRDARAIVENKWVFYGTRCTLYTYDVVVAAADDDDAAILQEDVDERPFVSRVINKLAHYEGGIVPNIEQESPAEVPSPAIDSPEVVTGSATVKKKKKKKKAAPKKASETLDNK